MNEHQYGGPGSYILVVISLVFGWINQLEMDVITFMISVGSGTLACISFSMRILEQWGNIKKNTKHDKGVDNEHEKDGRA